MDVVCDWLRQNQGAKSIMASFVDGRLEFESCLSEVLSNLETSGFKFVLKPEQKTAIENLYFGKDVLGVLPTGFGKSLIFQLLILVVNERALRAGLNNNKATLLVICPLRSLIQDQIKEVQVLGITATSLPEASAEDIHKYQVVYASAEHATDPQFLQSLKTGEFHNNMVAVVVDESHTLETWTGRRKTGNAGEKLKVFRKAFGELAILRTFCKRGIPILALTGTADKATSELIKRDLLLKDPVCLFVSPERKNIRFSVNKVDKDNRFDQLLWLVKRIKKSSSECPKTLIFCSTINDIAAVYNFLMFKLGHHAYLHTSADRKKESLIGIYWYSNSFKEHKERVFFDLKCLQGHKRVVVTSSALSMGVNFPDIRFVINWGPARDLLDQLQEAGRAGRDGMQSHLIIVYHGNQ